MEPIRAVIFDLDGVIVSTDECHYRAWQRLADEEGIPFDRGGNERLRGVSRMQSLEIILQRAARTYTDRQKSDMATRKNGYYLQLIQKLTPADALPGAIVLVTGLKARGVKVALASSSRNAEAILDLIGQRATFDAIVTGNDITCSKPDPQVFLIAARRLGAPPDQCLVVEDAEAGIQAALAAGMRALAVGPAAAQPGATLYAADLTTITPDDLLKRLC
jgi:beta-phosphoglucomutase